MLIAKTFGILSSAERVLKGAAKLPPQRLKNQRAPVNCLLFSAQHPSIRPSAYSGCWKIAAATCPNRKSQIVNRKSLVRALCVFAVNCSLVVGCRPSVLFSPKADCGIAKTCGRMLMVLNDMELLAVTIARNILIDLPLALRDPGGLLRCGRGRLRT